LDTEKILKYLKTSNAKKYFIFDNIFYNQFSITIYSYPNRYLLQKHKKDIQQNTTLIFGMKIRIINEFGLGCSKNVDNIENP
jgi:hypothetical protein